MTTQTNPSECNSECFKLGHLLKCQLPKGHDGKHVHAFTWSDTK